MPYSSVFLSKIIKDSNLEVVYDPGDIEERKSSIDTLFEKEIPSILITRTLQLPASGVFYYRTA